MLRTTKIILLGFIPLLLTKQGDGAGLTYTTRTTRHMFPFGDENGDEKISVGSLPVVKDLNDKIVFNRGKFDQLEIFAEGRIELHSKFVNVPFTPVLSPYELLYSRVTSGHVWYRDTNDVNELNEMKEKLQADINVDFTPRRLKVITWQFQDVEAKYPECLPENRANNHDFCFCLNSSWLFSGTVPHLGCECQYLITYNWINHIVCPCVSHNADYHYCACDDGSGHLSFDTRNYCICKARGGSNTAASCIATTHNAYFGSYGDGFLKPVEGCDFCGCGPGSRLGFCHCTHIDKYIALGMMKCYLLFAVGKGDCLMNTAVIQSMCDMAVTCESGGYSDPAECKCLLPATLTATELIECLLDNHSHSYIWLCDDPVMIDSHPLLQTYCSCIGNNQNVLDDEIYCKCLAHSITTSGDICQCLSDQGHSFNGITGCGSSKRSALPFQATEDQTEAIHLRTVRDAVTYMNTFQAVIAHGRRDTYVYFTYHKLEYSDKNIATRVGSISLDTSAFSGYEHPYPQHLFLLHFLLWDSNTGTDGRWLYKVNNHEVWEPQWTPTNSSTKY